MGQARWLTRDNLEASPIPINPDTVSACPGSLYLLLTAQQGLLLCQHVCLLAQFISECQTRARPLAPERVPFPATDTQANPSWGPHHTALPVLYVESSSWGGLATEELGPRVDCKPKLSFRQTGLGLENRSEKQKRFFGSAGVREGNGVKKRLLIQVASNYICPHMHGKFCWKINEDNFSLGVLFHLRVSKHFATKAPHLHSFLHSNINQKPQELKFSKTLWTSEKY